MLPEAAAAFSSPRSQFFPIRTDPKPANNVFIFVVPAVNWLTSGFFLRNFVIELAYARNSDARQRKMY